MTTTTKVTLTRVDRQLLGLYVEHATVEEIAICTRRSESSITAFLRDRCGGSKKNARALLKAGMYTVDTDVPMPDAEIADGRKQATCRVCGRHPLRLRADGRIGKHKDSDDVWCDGQGRMPKAVV